MSGRPELSVVLPAFNEGHVIESSLNHIDSVVRHMGLKYEIIVIDDGSVDDTQSKAANYAYKNGHVKVVGYERNMGKGHALKEGYMQAAGDAVIFVDSDLEIEFEKVASYVEALKHGDIVIASKRHRESIVEMPLIRRVLGHGFNLLIRLMTGLRLKDTQTGLKAIKRKAFEEIFPRLAVKRYAFDVELLAVADLYGLKIVDLPVNIKMRSLFSIKDVWRMFIDLLGIAYRLRVIRWYKRPIHYTSRSDQIID